jgi:FAD/FMN-containing dehydrogenase
MRSARVRESAAVNPPVGAWRRETCKLVVMASRAYAQPCPGAALPIPCSDPDSIARYLEDASGFTGTAEAVLLPENEAEVSAILRQAQRTGMPVTVSGAGTGLTGGRVAQGGWVVSLERLNRIVDLAPGRARVQPAVLLKDLQAAAQAAGQFYPPDPTENTSSIGGNIATNASGSRSFKYGGTRRYVRRLRLVLPNGDLLELERGQAHADSENRFEIVLAGGRVCELRLPRYAMPATTKHSAGYYFAPGMDLMDLFIGCEGTLGVVTEAELDLLPWPGEVLGGVVFFTGEAAALDFATRVRRLSRETNFAGPVEARLIEFFDRNALTLLRLHRYPETPAAARAAVLLEQETGAGSLEDAAERWLEVIEQSGGGDGAALLDDSWFAMSAAEREKFRDFRHAIALIVNETARQNGFPKLATDQAVPVERIGELLAFYYRELRALFGDCDPCSGDLQVATPKYTIYGHIGDAHLHVNMLPSDEASFQAAKALLLRFAEEAVRLGGTVAGEHGLGKAKLHFLKLQYPPEVIEAMRQIKLALDPRDLLNCGNLFGSSSLLQPA